MAESHARFKALVVWPAKTPGMRQLKANDQIIRRPVPFAMGLDQRFAQLRQVGFVLLLDDELVGIGASIRADGHRLAAANQFGPALAESRPAPQHFLSQRRRSACRPSLPSVARRNDCRCACR